MSVYQLGNLRVIDLTKPLDPQTESRRCSLFRFRTDDPIPDFHTHIDVYKRQLGNAYLIKDGDSCSIPFGYHPVAAPPGVKLYYLWCMAGTGSRQLLPNDDPNFAELHK